MPTPAITASSRYINPGVTKCYFLPTVAAANLTPTRAEMNAGTDLSGEIAEVSGWAVKGNDVPTPDLATTFTSKIPGRTEAEDSSLGFYASSNSVDVRSLLPRGTSGYIMWLDGGDVPTQKAGVFPVRVRSTPMSRSVGEDAAMITIEFSITREPAENVTIPA